MDNNQPEIPPPDLAGPRRAIMQRDNAYRFRMMSLGIANEFLESAEVIILWRLKLILFQGNLGKYRNWIRSTTTYPTKNRFDDFMHWFCKTYNYDWIKDRI